jgi:Mlc titration factor MtfA (ptsG expression regulator)
VATECFFERPLKMRRRQPELYGAMLQYYRQDTAERLIKAGQTNAE